MDHYLTTYRKDYLWPNLPGQGYGGGSGPGGPGGAGPSRGGPGGGGGADYRQGPPPPPRRDLRTNEMRYQPGPQYRQDGMNNQASYPRRTSIQPGPQYRQDFMPGGNQPGPQYRQDFMPGGNQPGPSYRQDFMPGGNQPGPSYRQDFMPDGTPYPRRMSISQSTPMTRRRPSNIPGNIAYARRGSNVSNAPRTMQGGPPTRGGPARFGLLQIL